MLATSKNVLFPGRNHLLTTGTDDPSVAGARLIIKLSGYQHLDLSRCPLLHKSLQPPVLRTVRVVIQPESSGWVISSGGYGSRWL